MDDNRPTNPVTEVKIKDRSIGPGHQTFIVAELSANHGGNLKHAIETIKAAAATGVDAIKLQTYTPDTITLKSDLPHFKISEGPWKGRRLYDLYEEAHTPWRWHEALFKTAEEEGLLCFSTPFDHTSVDFLAQFDPPCFKLASFELTDIPLIKKIASMGKPVIFSTGMATLAEIDQAVRTFQEHRCKELIGLRCVSAYPADPASFRLKTIPHLSESFSIPAGLSDHSLGSTMAIAAVALGANLIEKHFTLDRSKGGPDAAFSAEPNELKDLVTAVRNTEAATSSFGYGAGLEEAASVSFRKSIFVVESIHAGEVLSQSNIKVIRPGFGLQPKHYETLIGCKAATNLYKGDPLKWSDILPQ